ncbi:patatin-like phospholipase family protein [Glaciimonas sp. GNP009]
MIRFLLSLLAAVGLPFAPDVRPALAFLQRKEQDDVARTQYEAKIDAIVDGLVHRNVARGDNTLDLLLLSGGGQHGAYGIGFLRGWQSRSNGSMPDFDLVTGISTGGLQAPFALLGTAEALSQAAALYRNATTDFAPTFDWLFWLRRTGGLVKTELYRQMIEREMSGRMSARLQARFSEGRQLIIGTTDFDLGIGHLWDIGRELAAPIEGQRRVQQILLATTAIPGIFPPLILDDHLHADGGIVSNVLQVLDFDGYRKLAASLVTSGVMQPVTVRIWIVINMWTYPRPVSIDPSSRRSIVRRSNLLMFWTHQLQYLAGMKDMVRAVNAELPGLRLEMRYTSIPSELANEPGAADLFNQEWMTRIEKFGFERAQSSHPWDEITTPYARPVPSMSQEEQLLFSILVQKK